MHYCQWINQSFAKILTKNQCCTRGVYNVLRTGCIQSNCYLCICVIIEAYSKIPMCNCWDLQISLYAFHWDSTTKASEMWSVFRHIKTVLENRLQVVLCETSVFWSGPQNKDLFNVYFILNQEFYTAEVLTKSVSYNYINYLENLCYLQPIHPFPEILYSPYILLHVFQFQTYLSVCNSENN